MSRPLLVMFVGIPGSGKTTFARQLAKKLQAVNLNSDSLRIAMWKNLEAIQATHSSADQRKHANQLTFGAMNYAAEQAIRVGYDVVYDCNANHLWEREEKHEIASKYGAISLVVRMQVPYETSLKRVQQREESHDQRRISAERAESVLNRFKDEIEEPHESERVIRINGDSPFDEQYDMFRKGLHELQISTDSPRTF